MQCCTCGGFRNLTKQEISLMKNLSCYECNLRLKVVGIGLDFEGIFYKTEPEDNSLDF